MGVSIFFIILTSVCGVLGLIGWIYSQTIGDDDFGFGGFIGCTILGAFVALMVGLMTMNTDYSTMKITLADKKITISKNNEPADIHIVSRVGSETPGYDFLTSDGNGGLKSVAYTFEKISIEGDEFYIREVTRRSPSGFFNFRNTMTQHYLILPEKVLK